MKEDATENIAGGWLGGVYAGSNSKKNGDGTISYGFPAVSIRSPYPQPENLQAISEFADILKDKIVVMASGNSTGRIPATFQMPENVVLMATWDGDEQKPGHDFDGRPGQVYYADPSITTGVRMSSFATAMVSEWLCEQQIKNASEAKFILNQHTRVQKHTNRAVLDIGLYTTGNKDWNNPAKYQPIQ